MSGPDELPTPVSSRQNRRKSLSFSADALTPKEQVAMLVKAKREERESEDDYTFQPRIYHSPTSGKKKVMFEDGKTMEHDTFNKLHKDASRRKTLSEKAIKEALAETKPDFKPQMFTNDKMRKKLAAKNKSETDDDTMSVMSTRRRSSSAADALAENTFKPVISRRASLIVTDNSESSISDRMYAAAEAIRVKKKNLTEEMEDDFNKEATFQPKLNANRGVESGEELLIRMERYERERRKRQEDAVAAKEQCIADQHPFKPRIKVRRDDLMNQASSPERTLVTNVFERLTKPVPTAKSVQPRSQAKAKERTRSRSRSRSPSKQRNKNGEDWYDRLYSDAAVKKERLNQKAKAKEDSELASFTFQPQLSHGTKVAARCKEEVSTGDMLASKREDEGNPSPETKKVTIFEKLNTTPTKTMDTDLHTKIKDGKEMEGCTFKPNINKKSKVIAGNRFRYATAHERLLAEGKVIQMKKERLAREKELNEINSLDFSPQISPAVKAMSRRHTVTIGSPVNKGQSSGRSKSIYKKVSPKSDGDSPALLLLSRMDAILHVGETQGETETGIETV